MPVTPGMCARQCLSLFFSLRFFFSTFFIFVPTPVAIHRRAYMPTCKQYDSFVSYEVYWYWLVPVSSTHPHSLPAREGVIFFTLLEREYGSFSLPLTLSFSSSLSLHRVLTVRCSCFQSAGRERSPCTQCSAVSPNGITHRGTESAPPQPLRYREKEGRYPPPPRTTLPVLPATDRANVPLSYACLRWVLIYYSQ